MFRMFFRSGLVGAHVLVVLGLVSVRASAQTPTITSFPSTVAAGPDYATDVLGNPWDFSDAADLSPFPDELAGWTISATTARTQGRSAFISGGQFTATTTTGGGSLIPLLFRGGVDFITSNSENAGVFDHKAIPTGAYGKLALQMTLPSSTSGQLSAFWHSGAYGSAGGRSVAFRTPQSGTHLYIVDLATGIWTDAQGNAMGPTFFPVGADPQVAWNAAALMRGFMIRPTSDGAASVNVQVNWVRITQSDGGAGAGAMPIAFTDCVSKPYSIEAAPIGSSTFDVIHTGTSSGGAATTAQVNHGVLAPGTWSIRVTCYQTGSRAGAGASSTPVTVDVNDPPHVTITNPDAAGGADFATTVMSNAWDMNAVSDVARSFGIVNPSIVSDGVTNSFQATATGTGDPVLILLFGTHNVDTSRFKHLRFSLTLDTPFGLNGAVGDGSVARLFWERLSGGSPVTTTTEDILVWPGRNVYTMDLSQLTSLLLEPGGQPWAAGTVYGFRIDPHESTKGVTFRLGPVTIGASDEVASGGTFAVQYSIADADTAGSSYTARFYLDTDRNAAVKTLVGTSSGVAPNTPLSFNLNPGATPNGEYFLFVEVTETRGGVTDVRGQYAGGPLRIGPAGPQPPGAPVLTATQTASNPVSVAWAAGPGDAPTSYVLSAGTAAGATNFGTFQMGLATSAAGNVPFGIPIFVRVTALNAVGATMSNELSFVAGPVLPGAPTMNPHSLGANRTVTLSWNPPASGGGPTSYTVVARYPGSPAIIATLPVAGTGLVVPNVPPGTYVVTVVAVNAAGTGPESNSIVVTVP